MDNTKLSSKFKYSSPFVA